MEGFQVHKWLRDIDTYRHFAAKGLKIMDHLSDDERNTLLQIGLANADFKFIDVLIENGLTLTKPRKDRLWDPVNIALRVISDDEAGLSLLGYLHKNGCSFNQQESDYAYQSQTPLVQAVQLGLIKVTDFLLSHGAILDFDVYQEIGSSLNPAFIECLMKNGISIKAEGHMIQSAIASTRAESDCYRNDNNWEGDNNAISKKNMIQTLLEAGVDPNSFWDAERTGEKHGNVLHSLFNQHSFGMKFPEIKEIFNILLHYGLELNATDENGETILQTMTEQRNAESVKLLIDAGASVNATYTIEETHL